MKLHFSATSPFVRKVMICAHEKGIADAIEIAPEGDITATNPLSKVPALVTDDGAALFDSLVICHYLDNIDGNPTLIPADAKLCTGVLCRHALADGIMEAAVASVVETRRPADKQWTEFLDKQRGKIDRAIDVLEAQADGFGDTVDLGTIAAAAALGYLDFRMGDIGWRRTHPRLARWHEEFSTRSSMQKTAPPA